MTRTLVGLFMLFVLMIPVYPAFGAPLIELQTHEQWEGAYEMGLIQPVREWNMAFESHYPGMEAQLRIPGLFVLDGFQGVEEAGLLMVWGYADDVEREVIAAWEYLAGQGQDFSGTTIRLSVLPPAHITSIDFGLKDANGRLKSWDWIVGSGGLTSGDQHSFTIDPTGGAGQAGSTSYHECPGFDLTNVVSLMFSENARWVNSIPVSPIGVPGAWNYWKDIRVIDGGDGAKSRQPWISLSVAEGGPSTLRGADILTTSPLNVAIPFVSLGLVTGDDLDALSYGDDPTMYIQEERPLDLRFSVDQQSIGSGAVNLEATSSPNEAHGDEFIVTPPFPPGGSNGLVLDENGLPSTSGQTAPPIGLIISDDLDALTGQDPSAIDANGDSVPDRPVFFSLDPASPSLSTIPAGPADILMTSGGPAPTVYASLFALGLVPGDDLDAMCLYENGDGKWSAPSDLLLFSLAPGSPTLSRLGWSPADILVVGGLLGAAPARYAPARALGLQSTDNLNALKCLGEEPKTGQHGLPPGVGVGPIMGIGPGGVPHVHWGIPTTFTYDAPAGTTDVYIEIVPESGGRLAGRMTQVPGTNTWEYTVQFWPDHHGLATVTYTVYPGGTTVTFTIFIDPSGIIYNVVTGEPIEGATVTLEKLNETTGQFEVVAEDPTLIDPPVNPQLTGPDGGYGWDALAGTYRVQVTAPGFAPVTSREVTIPPPVTDLDVGLTPTATAIDVVVARHTGDPKVIEDADILWAVELWIADAIVPGTDGRRIDDAMILTLVEMWITETPVGGSAMGLAPADDGRTALAVEKIAFTGSRFIAMGSGIESMAVRVYDLAGRQVFADVASGNALRLEMSSPSRVLANGVYLYSATVRGYDGSVMESKIRKLVILR